MLENLKPIGENFDLLDLPIQHPQHFHLMNLRNYFGPHIQENLETFETIFRSLYNQGYLLYHREIRSAIRPRTRVWDHVSQSEYEMLMFGSNNYLGFADEPLIKKKVIETIGSQGIGMAGPMILNGTSSLHRELEKKLARFKGYEDALIIPTGYQANLAWVSALLTDQSVLIYDESSHASLIDAIRMSRRKAFRFSDNDSLETLLMKFRQDDAVRDIWVCTQGVFSMTGEVSDLKSISDLCEKYRAFFVVDDAHGTGVLGRGKGTPEHFKVSRKLKLSMGTFSKAFAVTGGFLAGDKNLINFIRFFARPYFFTAAMPPMTVSAVMAGLEILENNPGRTDQIQENIRLMSALLTEAGINHNKNESAIIAVYPPRPDRFREIALALHNEKLFVNPIEPPAVAVGEERFRVSVMATHSKSEIEEAVQIMKTVFNRYQI